ncbi:4-hydroxyphenylacetate 3-hydroxylase family protein [Amycolatopsis sp. CFH S0740]|uniref:4-hydroxyphenylacetate 3-hydroxylase family protein n=1 Tax=Amycolatopsis sp. CFH S0740 TaxID=1644111 RepID=UPI00106F4944|nr:4-hydroxyphenylacetate 3-hydroxylase N-terminal domain-containing protein [Amycolatopsis sp. CFH S0740]
MTTTEDRAGEASAPAVTTPSPNGVKPPPTGAEYLETLRDGRVFYFEGEQVDDVTTHPAFTTTAHSVARMYDALHDPAKQDKLTFVTERGTRSHKFYKMATTSEDLFESRDAIAEWARMSYGSLSRGPDYKAGLVAALAADADFYGDFAGNVRKWYEKTTDDVMFVNLSLLNPSSDRTRSIADQRDTYMHVVKERDDGIVVRGARMISTGAAFSQVTYVSQYVPAAGLGVDDKDFALGFFVPFDAPGVKLIGRYSYEYMAKKIGTPFDYPLSSRFDESDYSVILDDVFIPWENVTVYRNPEVVNGLFPRGFAQRFIFHACTRTAVKLDFLCGLLLKVTEMNKVSAFRGVQAQIGEVLGMRHNLWALATAMAAEPNPAVGGGPYVHPNVHYALQWRNIYGDMFSRIRTIFHNVMAGGFIQIPSSAKDFKNPATRHWLDKYWNGAEISAEQRVKLIRLVWDEFATEFGGRAEVHERNFSGSYEGNRVETFHTGEAVGSNAYFRSMVDQCMSEYDLDGWTDPAWPAWKQIGEA